MTMAGEGDERRFGGGTRVDDRDEARLRGELLAMGGFDDGELVAEGRVGLESAVVTS